MSRKLTLRVTRRRMLTPDITEFELADASGHRLPTIAPGAHLTVQTPSGLHRSYSITGTSTNPSRYYIAVQRDPRSRGGSMSMIDRSLEGDSLPAQTPRNAFELAASDRHLLIAGGIGITPIRAMFHHLRNHTGARVRLVYLTRSANEAAYLDDLQDTATVVHHDDQDGILDLWPFVAEPREDTRIYCCGPPGLMTAVQALTVHWRPSQVHFERFSQADPSSAIAEPFTAVWAPTGQKVRVSGERSFLDALRDAQLPVRASCETGTCNTCRLRLLDGEGLHRDLILTSEERQSAILPCVSRASSLEITVAPLDD